MAILRTRTGFSAEVIEREVLRKRQKALLIFGQGWFTRNQQRKTPNGFVPVTDTIGALLDKDFPGRIYVITPIRGGIYPETPNLERLIGRPDLPVLLRLKGTVFGTLDANEFIPAHSSLLLGAPPPPFHQFRDGARWRKSLTHAYTGGGPPMRWSNQTLPTPAMPHTQRS